jgi:hypothetical protein
MQNRRKHERSDISTVFAIATIILRQAIHMLAIVKGYAGLCQFVAPLRFRRGRASQNISLYRPPLQLICIPGLLPAVIPT